MKLEMRVDYNPGDPGEYLGVDEERCTGCGECAKFCARDVWVKQGTVYRPANPGNCVECGACWNVCADDAVILGEPRGGTGVRFAYG